ICFIIAYTYLRYTTPQFQATTIVLVKDEKKGGMYSELSVFSDMGLGGGAIKSIVDNEIEILKSRTLYERAVQELGLIVSLIVKGKVFSTKIYKVNPMEICFVNVKPAFYTSKVRFEFVKLTPNTFELTSESTVEGASILLSDKKEFRYGDIIPTQNGDLVITKSINYNKIKIEGESIS